jgi:hypothetical protein
MEVGSLKTAARELVIPDPALDLRHAAVQVAKITIYVVRHRPEYLTDISNARMAYSVTTNRRRPYRSGDVGRTGVPDRS